LEPIRILLVFSELKGSNCTKWMWRVHSWMGS
jgi:hypothetical protein